MNTKHAQAEIVGLMIIVVIITIAMLFYLSYVTTQTESNTNNNIRKEFIDNELSMSFVQSMYRMSIPECNDLSLDVIIKDCGLGENLIDCGGVSSCQIVELALTVIKNETLDVWDKSYSLQVKYGESSMAENITFSTYGCAEGTIGRGSPGSIPVPYYPDGDGVAYLELALCKK